MFSGGKNVIRIQKSNRLKKFRDTEEEQRNTKKRNPKNKTEYRLSKQENLYE